MISIQDASITCISCRGDSHRHVPAIFKECCVIIIKKNQKEVPSALKIQTGGYWPLQFLSCLPLFLLLLHFFCLSTAKCSWSHTNEKEGHERKEMKLDISALHIGQGLVIFIMSVLFSFICHTFCLVQGQSARFFIKFQYTQIHTYRQMQPV